VRTAVAGSRSALLLAAALALAACTATPRRPERPPGTGDTIAAIAAALVGTPYQFGGADTAGFDCSGLALYVYERAGLDIPRTARRQQLAARPVPLAQIEPGDLVFFSLHAHRVDHVGIYAGGGRFIHAPRARLAVAYADLTTGYYHQHFVSAGRFRGPVP
jgi:cell wall-associated NlpC family hydrolase